MLRLLLALISGILLQHYYNLALWLCIAIFSCGILQFLFFGLLNTAQKFAANWLSGLAVHFLFIGLGATISYVDDIENHSHWLANDYHTDSKIIAIIQEPLIEKAKSFKTIARAEFMIDRVPQWVEGNIILYFKKESELPPLHYGSTILIHSPLQLIGNTDNPGGFNYQQYCHFQDIYYQAYLTSNDIQLLSTEKKFFLKNILLQARAKVLAVLRKNISDTSAISIAEALLIGYRDDLDKDLVQAYSNTGVVHIIAISGLHIAMIYGLIVFFMKPFYKKKWIKWVKPCIVLIVIWAFTCIAGAAPSILRSAIMFSFIVIGEAFGKRVNIYNNLAASAFAILLFNPYSLWDVGFQLSYAAVLSIVIFSKQVAHWLYFSNKLLRSLWQLCAVTISAQILTLPFILFYFHQFPGLFIVTNLVVVPLSGFILYAELLLLIVAPLHSLATITGNLIRVLINSMNHFILFIDFIPYATLSSIQINVIQTICLFFMIAFLAYWFIDKKASALITAIISITIFFAIRSIDLLEKNNQQKLIVYNIPKHEAIDIVDGRTFQFIGDSILCKDEFLTNFHLKPARNLYRIKYAEHSSHIYYQNKLIAGTHKKVFLIDQLILTTYVNKKITVDVILLSKGAELSIDQLLMTFDCKSFVFDASNPVWKINQWKKECENLHLRHYSIPEQGAFVMDL